MLRGFVVKTAWWDTGVRSQNFRISGVQEFRSSGVQEFRS